MLHFNDSGDDTGKHGNGTNHSTAVFVFGFWGFVWSVRFTRFGALLKPRGLPWTTTLGSGASRVQWLKVYRGSKV